MTEFVERSGLDDENVGLNGSSVDEVHIDFLLEEEFYTDLGFLQKFIDFTERAETAVQVDRVEHSVSDEFGETDILVIYRLNTGEQIALLIEDKIAACFQPRQAERYRERGESGKGKNWDAFWTCLVAPQSYIKPSHGFDLAVSLEDLRDWLATDNPRRREFKQKVITQAIEKKNRSGVKNVNAIMSEFRRRYFEFAEVFFKNAGADIDAPPPRMAGHTDTWLQFKSRYFFKGLHINHKTQPGFVELTFPQTDKSVLDPIVALLENGMTVEQTGKSCVVRLKVLPAKNYQTANDEYFGVACAAIHRLFNFYKLRQNEIEKAVASPE